jgi:hypothetical protein
MNAIKTVGLPMWRVSMIGWKRRSEKRFIRLIRSVDGFLIRLFEFARTISTTTGHQDPMARKKRQRAL